MKKTALKIFITSVLLLAAMLSLASCDMLPEGVAKLFGGKKECTHAETTWVIDTPASCKMEGLKHSECNSCGAVIESNVVIEKSSEHTTGDWETELASTCIREGSRYKRCSVCKRKVVTDTIPLSEIHTYSCGACSLCSAEQPASTGLQFVPHGDGTCSVGGIGSCTDASIVIPELSPAGDRVIAISANAFLNKSSITSVVIPDCVASVGADAFKGTSIIAASVPASAVGSVKCNSIKNLTVTGSGSIPASAMAGAPSLERLIIKDGVTEIGEGAFVSCTKLYNISIPDSLTVIGTMAFEKCTALTGKLTLGAGVVKIGDKAFYGVNRITGVVIPESVRYIGINAFVSLLGVYGRNDSSIVDVEFAVTSGWYAASNPEDASGTPLSSTILEDNSLAADALSNSYGGFYLKRN